MSLDADGAVRLSCHRGRRPRSHRGDQQIADVLGLLEPAGWRDAYALVAHLQIPGIHHGVLQLQRVVYVARIEAPLGELLFGDVDIDHFVLHAPQLHARHTVHQTQVFLQEVRIILQLGIGIPVTGHCQHVAIDKTEVIGNVGFAGTRWQQRRRVTELLANLVPDLRQAVFPVLVLDLDLDIRHPGPGVGQRILQLRDLPQRLLEPVGDLQFHLLGGGARVLGDDDALLDREDRVFQLAERHQPDHSANEENPGHHPGDRRIVDEIFDYLSHASPWPSA